MDIKNARLRPGQEILGVKDSVFIFLHFEYFVPGVYLVNSVGDAGSTRSE